MHGAFQVSLLDASQRLSTSPISLRVARDLFVQAIDLLNQILKVASMTATRFFCTVRGAYEEPAWRCVHETALRGRSAAAFQL